VQMVRTHLNTPQLVFCPDLVGCVPVTEVQWVAADADAHAPVMRDIPETVR
jgi:plastocyanin